MTFNHTLLVALFSLMIAGCTSNDLPAPCTYSQEPSTQGDELTGTVLLNVYTISDVDNEAVESLMLTPRGNQRTIHNKISNLGSATIHSCDQARVNITPLSFDETNVKAFKYNDSDFGQKNTALTSSRELSFSVKTHPSDDSKFIVTLNMQEKSATSSLEMYSSIYLSAEETTVFSISTTPKTGTATVMTIALFKNGK